MSHPNAFLAPKGRLELAQCIVNDGWTYRRAAETIPGLGQHRQTVGRPLPRRRRSRDGRPLQPAPCQPGADPEAA